MLKKVLILMVLILSSLSFSTPYKDERGILVMEYEEWEEFYNNPGGEDEMCLIIGSLIMEESYLKEGKKVGKTLEENQSIIRSLNYLLSEGLDVESDGMHEYYYVNFCKKPTEKELNLVGSPTFKREMNKIFSTYDPKK